MCVYLGRRRRILGTKGGNRSCNCQTWVYEIWLEPSPLHPHLRLPTEPCSDPRERGSRQVLDRAVRTQLQHLEGLARLGNSKVPAQQLCPTVHNPMVVASCTLSQALVSCVSRPVQPRRPSSLAPLRLLSPLHLPESSVKRQASSLVTRQRQTSAGRPASADRGRRSSCQAIP